MEPGRAYEAGTRDGGSDLPRLRALGRAVCVVARWAVILQHLVVIPREHRSEDVVRTVKHFYSLCLEMLREQGLELVRPEDLCHRESPLVTASWNLLAGDAR